jgi:hypothetical protein
MLRASAPVKSPRQVTPSSDSLKPKVWHGGENRGVAPAINRMATARGYEWEDFGNRRVHGPWMKAADFQIILVQISE